MSNANRDYVIVYDVKNSLLVLSRPLVFYITDKNTSNIFVRLVTRIIIGDGIDQYTDIENASNYVLTMRVIKPDNEVKSIIATQHEPESIFQFDLTEDFKDVPGKYICELTISNIVNGRQELITSDAFNYEVKRSILSKVNIIEGEGTTVEKLLNDLDAAKAEMSSQVQEKATKAEVDVERKRIDAFISLPEGSATGDAELIDGRIGADGVTYSNIGTAIRTQCGNLNNLLDIGFEVTSNNRIDDSNFVGKNFDTLIGHDGNAKTFKLESKLKSNKVKGFIQFEDGTSPDPNSGFFWSLKSSTGATSSVTLSVTGTLVIVDDFGKYDQISIGSWGTYNKTIKTVFVGDFNDSYDKFKKEGKSKVIEDMKSKANNITPEQCTFFNKVDNLLKGVALQKGHAINPSYGLPDAISGVKRTSTDYIKLRDDCESTYCNTNGYIYYYDSNKNYLKSITPQSTETPAGIVALPQSNTKIKYIRYTFVTEDDSALASYWITDQGKPYENDKLYIPKDMVEDMSETESWYKGKKICAYGDSVTEQNKWQPYVSAYFNCSFYNRGVGGTTVTQINSSTNHMSGDTRINSIPTDSDVILIFAGHNDWSYASIAMGDLKTDALSESTSFRSAFALMIKKIQNRCPNARLITMTPVGGRTENASANQDKQFYVRDLCMTDFAIAVKEVSAYYGIPCIDVNANSGISTLNHTTYIADLIHPNEAGGKLIANEVINGMKRFQPIDL